MFYKCMITTLSIWQGKSIGLKVVLFLQKCLIATVQPSNSGSLVYKNITSVLEDLLIFCFKRTKASVSFSLLQSRFLAI